MYDLLKSKLPISCGNGQSFASCVAEVLADYKKLTTSVFKDDENYGKVNGFINVVPKIIELYFQGRISQAYSLFKEPIANLISEDENGFSGVLPVINNDCKWIIELNPDDYRYYYRISDYENSFPHIPFEKREFVGSKRFTVPGLPCFYGGNSIETCIAEIGDTVNLDKCFVSCFDYDYPQVTLLDLTLPKIRIDEVDYFDKAIFSWPLVALCMIRRSGNSADKNAKFFPEYIFPQFVLEYLAESEKTKIRAVRYFSTKPGNLDEHINIAIPIQESNESGHCGFLMSLFNERQRINLGIISGYSKPVKMSSLTSKEIKELRNKIEYFY